jgi:signal transduction histidine kinase
VVASLVSGVYIRARRANVASLVERAAQLEVERDQQARLAAAAERARIAREMHDIIAHSLAVVIALVDGANAKLERHPDQAREALTSVAELARQALDDTRRLLSVLREDDGVDARSPQPGLGDVTRLLDQVTATGIATELVTEGHAVALQPGPSLAAYRIVQEAITNALKYADGASSITVTLRWTAHELAITVVDDGRGASTPVGERGFGLAGMRERAALYGGGVTARAKSDGGWIVEATLALDERGAS